MVSVRDDLKSFGSDFELAIRWIYDLSLFLTDDRVVMFLMDIFLSNLSLILTCDKGGKTTGAEYVMLL